MYKSQNCCCKKTEIKLIWKKRGVLFHRICFWKSEFHELVVMAFVDHKYNLGKLLEDKKPSNKGNLWVHSEGKV